MLPDQLRQRIFGGALGCADLIGHDALRFDPSIAACLGKPGDKLVGKSMLKRLEHGSKNGHTRHHKSDHDLEAVARISADMFLGAHREPPGRIVIDLDATDDPPDGEQEGRHFRGYYGCYC